MYQFVLEAKIMRTLANLQEYALAMHAIYTL